MEKNGKHMMMVMIIQALVMSTRGCISTSNQFPDNSKMDAPHGKLPTQTHSTNKRHLGSDTANNIENLIDDKPPDNGHPPFHKVGQGE